MQQLTGSLQEKEMILGGIFDIVWPSYAAFVVECGAPCRLEIPSWTQKPYLGPVNEIRVADYQCNSCQVPYQSRKCFLVILNVFWPT